MKQNNEIVLWIEESEQLQAEHQATNSGAASGCFILDLVSGVAAPPKQEVNWAGSSFFN